MQDGYEMQCPWCFAPVLVVVNLDQTGSYTEDCEVCCRPWVVFVDGEIGEERSIRLERE